MNANYQYFMMSGYDYAAGKGGGKVGDIIGGGGSGGGGSEDIEEVSIDSKAPSLPSIENDTIDDISPIDSKPISTIGDASIISKEPTTINIYSPESSTSTTSTESEVTVDATTGKVTTPASKGGAKGGGMGGSKGKKGNSAPKKTKAKKAILPLALIGIGVAIIIFKPLKFLK
jgi:hypothetical protein